MGHICNSFSSDSSTAELTNAAFKCAAAAYKADPIAADALDLDPLPTGLTGISGNPGMHRNPETTGVKFTELEYIYPSLGGSSKAIGFWIAESEVSVSQNSNFPALIVAVRGTEKFVDHIVNANSRPTAAAGFLVGLSSVFHVYFYALLGGVSLLLGASRGQLSGFHRARAGFGPKQKGCPSRQ